MLNLVRVNHATVLLEFGSIRVLTDPWLTDRWGWRRSEPQGLSAEQIRPVHVVLASHHHPDHYDLAGLRTVCPETVPLVVRAGTGPAAHKYGFRSVHEMHHWDEITPIPGLKVTATPARHSAPENTYVIESGGFAVFFGGDTRLIPEFTEVARRFPAIDVALLPINGVRIFGKRTVMDPEEAVEACRILSPRVVVPIHYGMRAGWKSGWLLRQPGTPEMFKELLEKSGLTSTEARLLRPGEVLSVRQRCRTT